MFIIIFFITSYVVARLACKFAWDIWGYFGIHCSIYIEYKNPLNPFYFFLFSLKKYYGNN